MSQTIKNESRNVEKKEKSLADELSSRFMMRRYRYLRTYLETRRTTIREGLCWIVGKHVTPRGRVMCYLTVGEWELRYRDSLYDCLKNATPASIEDIVLSDESRWHNNKNYKRRKANGKLQKKDNPDSIESGREQHQADYT